MRPTSSSRACMSQMPREGGKERVARREGRSADLARHLDRDGRRCARPRCDGRSLTRDSPSAHAPRSHGAWDAGGATPRPACDQGWRTCRPGRPRGLSPIDDLRGTADYRADAALTIVRRLLARSADEWSRREAETGLAFRVNGRAVTVGDAAGDSRRSSARTWAHRHQGRVRRRGLRRLHRPAGRSRCCACLVPIGQVAGRRGDTVEGLARDGRLDPLQSAFLAHGAVQCGACIPGMLMAADDCATASAQTTGRGGGCAQRRPVSLHWLSDDPRCGHGSSGVADAGPWPRARVKRSARASRAWTDGRGSTARSGTRPTSRPLAR